MSMPTFAELDLSAELQKNLDRLGLEEPAPVQTAVLLALTSSRSAVIAAPARSGRATALAIAAARHASASSTDGVRAVILAGTRTRALHLTALTASLGSGKKSPPVACLVAGQNPARREESLQKTPAIVVATPGALREELVLGRITLAPDGVLLIDRADEQLDMGLEEDVEAIIASPATGRTVVALATQITRELEALTARRIPEADRLVSEPVPPPSNLTWFGLESTEKLEAVSLILDRHPLPKAMVVVGTAAEAEAVASGLNLAGYTAEAVTSEATATARERAAKRFRQGTLTVVVGTLKALSGAELEAGEAVIHWGWPLDDNAFSRAEVLCREGGPIFALASGREQVRARAVSRRGSPVRFGRIPLLGEPSELRLQANVARIREALAGRNPAACRSVVDQLVSEGFDPVVIAGAAVRLLGLPELPSFPPPPPPPAPAPAVAAIPTPSRPPAPVEAAPESPAVQDAPAQTYPETEQTDWSPGIGAASLDDSGTYSEGGADGGDGGYAYSDNAAEDGVVYPPEANFGDDESGGDGSGEDRSGRRPRRGGRTRGGGRGGDGGPATAGMKRLWLNIGRMDRIQPRDIVGCILGETGLPAATVGRVQLFERHSLVDVSATFESQILESLNSAAVKGRKLKAKIAAY